MPRRMGILDPPAHVLSENRSTKCEEKVLPLTRGFFDSPGTKMLCFVICVSYGVAVQTDWTFSVPESWRIDKEGSMEINVENRCPAQQQPREKTSKALSNNGKDKEDIGRE